MVERLVEAQEVVGSVPTLGIARLVSSHGNKRKVNKVHLTENPERWNIRASGVTSGLEIRTRHFNLGYGTARGGRLPCKQDIQQGSIPWCSTNEFVRIAHLGEHLPYKQGVIGSSPVAGTIYFRSSIG